MSDCAEITCEGLEWLGDVPIFYSSTVVVLALNNPKREDLVQVWECLVCFQAGLDWEWRAIIMLPKDLPWPSATWARALRSAGVLLQNAADPGTCAHCTGFLLRAFTRTKLWLALQFLSAAGSGQVMAFQSSHVCDMASGLSALELPCRFLWGYFLLGRTSQLDGQFL